MYKNLINNKVLVRSYDAGVYFGTLTAVKGETCRLENVRNIWQWTGANTLSDIAIHGIKGDKVTPIISSMVLNRVCQILPLSDEAIKNLEAQPVWSAE